MDITAKITAAADYLKSRTTLRPTICLVLGSGLGDFADTLEESVRIPYAEIPNFPLPTIPGHSGALVFGKVSGKTVVVLQGRIHYYEGLSMQEITLPVRVAAALGVKTLVLTNACGGVNTAFHPGDLMLISDHLNCSGMNPLIGPNLDALGPRFPDMSDLYTASLRAAIKEAAAEAGIPLREGVYAMYSGPNYETPAEIRMFRTMGADTVGMSTVPGHSGAMVFGKKCGQTVVVLQGRIHYYEGLPQKEITLPIRVLAAIGIRSLVLTNAAGGVNLNYRPGDLMLIADHINLSGDNPLRGPNLDAFGPRFPDCCDIYTADLRRAIRKIAAANGIALQEGVYGMYSGPNYETPAEIRMYRAIGADVVGMSTVPEALVAAHCGIRVVGISCITNMAAGILPQKLSHAEVTEVAAQVHDKFQHLLDLVLTVL